MTIKSKIQIEGYCKKIKNKDLYGYPETPASVYRLARTGDSQWKDYPYLKKQWDDQVTAVGIAKKYYEKQR